MRHEATIRGSVGAYVKKHEGDISIDQMLTDFGIPREAILREPSVCSAAVKELLDLGYVKARSGNSVVWRKKARCGAESATFDAPCILDAGHDGKHKSAPFTISVEWPDGESKGAVVRSAQGKVAT